MTDQKLEIRDLKALMAKYGDSLPSPWDRDFGAATESNPWHVYTVDIYGAKPHRLWSCRTRQSAHDIAKKNISTYRKAGGYALVHNWITGESHTIR
jgi:hypothetical protein